jgi:hypothetical protein
MITVPPPDVVKTLVMTGRTVSPSRSNMTGKAPPVEREIRVARSWSTTLMVSPERLAQSASLMAPLVGEDPTWVPLRKTSNPPLSVDTEIPTVGVQVPLPPSGSGSPGAFWHPKVPRTVVNATARAYANFRMRTSFSECSVR